MFVLMEITGGMEIETKAVECFSTTGTGDDGGGVIEEGGGGGRRRRGGG